jgi:hypothetical protein
MLEMIKRKAGLNCLYWRLKNSIEEIEEKHPERIDILEPMRESMLEVAEAIEYFNHCERQNTVNSSRIYGLEIENLKLKQENNGLKRQIDNLINEI